MTVSTRRVWRAAPPTLVLVAAFAVVAGVVMPILAWLIYRHEHTLWLPMLLAGLTVLAVVYAWRFGLHPKLSADDAGISVSNPIRRYLFEWDDVTVIAPGENGLIIGSEDRQAEAWCIQKSNHASKLNRTTRADRVAGELIDLLETHQPPVSDEQTGLRIRRARPDEHLLLTRIEQASSEDAFAHVFPPEEYPFPLTQVATRWRRLLRDRLSWVYLLELKEEPVGFVAFTADTLLHLAVLPEHRRRGYGSALLEFATTEMFDRGIQRAQLWVLTGNQPARAFYASYGWQDTQERQNSEFPPFPELLRMVRPNPAAPRRSREAGQS
jgi:ribosomal protein S18 acetylase RimI-like enzyme